MENTEESVEAEKKKVEVEANEQAQESQSESTEEPEAANEEVTQETSEDDTYKDKYYYLAAEMQNLQKRFDREKQSLLKYGNEKILNDLVEIIDNFERTLGFIEDDEDEKTKNIVVGIEMIQKLFLDTLEKHGLKKIDALGKEFDPNFHEALAQQPAEGKKEMEVIMVHQNGYTLNDRVIRAAKVIVAKND